MNEKMLVLERNIQVDLDTIDRLYEALGSPDVGDETSQDALIVTAYRLHAIYTALENIFRNIAHAFENHVGQESWHRELLQRMRLDLTPIRPAVIDTETYEKLDELRRFRHVFRTMYGLNLDPLRLHVVLRRALELKPVYRAQIEGFLQFLRGPE